MLSKNFNGDFFWVIQEFDIKSLDGVTLYDYSKVIAHGGYQEFDHEIEGAEEEFIINREGELISFEYEYEDLYQRENIDEFENESSCISAFKKFKESLTDKNKK